MALGHEHVWSPMLYPGSSRRFCSICSMPKPYVRPVWFVFFLDAKAGMFVVSSFRTAKAALSDAMSKADERGVTLARFQIVPGPPDGTSQDLDPLKLSEGRHFLTTP